VEVNAKTVERLVRSALAEDVGAGDLTTEGLVPPEASCSGALYLEEPGIVCGLHVVETVFKILDPALVWQPEARDGDGPTTGSLARLSGRARAILTGERTALNLLGRLCGIATLTRRYVDAVAGTGVTILDTRKTTPGLRALEKYAVRCGGGVNHRFGLDDAILVKENHLRVAGGIAPAVAALRNGRATKAALVGGPAGRLLEVEAETLAEVEEALAAGVDRILLDNMTPTEVRRAVELTAGRAQTEASGGVTLETVRDYAGTGVDFISVGALTHAARSLHVSLEIE